VSHFSCASVSSAISKETRLTDRALPLWLPSLGTAMLPSHRQLSSAAPQDEADMDAEHNCPTHRRPCKERKEENYFFRLSKYQKQIEVV
jgi:hypothetical protein